MNKSFLFAILMISLLAGCTQSKKLFSSTEGVKVEFVEVRRLNHTINLEEVTAIHTMNELVELYGKLNDPNFPRQAPIPPFDESTETVLVVKPKLVSMQFGDIQIENLLGSGSGLLVNYKEVENWEFTENKWSNPIVIIKVKGKFNTFQTNRIN